MPDDKTPTIAEDFGKYVESFAVIQTGTVSDDGEIAKFASPVVISVWARREKANSMKKRQATRVGRIHKWFASDDAIPTPLLAVRVVMTRKPVARKPKIENGADKPLAPDATIIPEDVRKDASHRPSPAGYADPPKAKRK